MGSQTIAITLPNDVRLFTKFGKKVLAKTEKSLRKDSSIDVGPPEDVIFDHRDQRAVPYRVGVVTYYILLEEIRSKGLVDRLERFAKLRLAHSRSGSPD